MTKFSKNKNPPIPENETKFAFLDKIGILKRDLYLFHSKTSCEKKSDF